MSRPPACTQEEVIALGEILQFFVIASAAPHVASHSAHGDDAVPSPGGIALHRQELGSVAQAEQGSFELGEIRILGPGGIEEVDRGQLHPVVRLSSALQDEQQRLFAGCEPRFHMSPLFRVLPAGIIHGLSVTVYRRFSVWGEAQERRGCVLERNPFGNSSAWSCRRGPDRVRRKAPARSLHPFFAACRTGRCRRDSRCPCPCLRDLPDCRLVLRWR